MARNKYRLVHAYKNYFQTKVLLCGRTAGYIASDLDKITCKKCLSKIGWTRIKETAEKIKDGMPLLS